MKSIIYTLGYTSFCNSNNIIDVELMFNTLKKFKVNYLIDVRSIPFSKQFPQSNAGNLKAAGKHFNVRYVHMPELGAKAQSSEVFSKAGEIFVNNDVFPIPKSRRPENTELTADDLIVDFKKFIYDDTFKDGLNRIAKAYEQQFVLALMCSEKNPLDCHRYFLISRAIEERMGDLIEVHHIIKKQSGDITTITNKELDQMLQATVLKMEKIKKLNIDTIDLLGGYSVLDEYEGNTPDEQKFDLCYRFWNLMHGWKIDSPEQTD